MSEEQDATTQEAEDLIQARKQLEKIFKENKAIEDDIMKMGAAPRPDVVLMIKLDLLAAYVLGDGLERYAFEIEFQRRIGDTLRQIQQQVYEDSQKRKLLLPDPTMAAPNQVLLPK